MIEQKKQWLVGTTWESIVNVNRSLCQAQKVEPHINPRTHESAQRVWDQSRQKSTSLLEAIDACHEAFDQSPFTFNNGNTFAAIARSLVEEHLRQVPAVEAQILRSTIGHYVAGTIGRKEIAQVLGQLAPLLNRHAAPSRPSATEIAVAGLTEARPVASS